MTPVVKVNRMTIGVHYVVKRICDDSTFIAYDDYGIERMCYNSDFKKIDDLFDYFPFILLVFLIATIAIFIFNIE